MKKILIVEDEKPLARVLALKLNSAGFLATVVSDGEEALATLQKDNFNLIILDLLMPKKDGYYMLGELQKIGNKIPVIVSSNLSQKEDIEKVKKLGAVDYIVKSDITLSEIVEKIKWYLQ